MNRNLLAALLLAGTVAAGAGTTLAQQAAPAPQADPAQQTAAQPGPVLSMQQVIDRLTQQGWKDISEIEHEHGKYEVKARGADGVRMEMDIDERTGAILKQKRD